MTKGRRKRGEPKLVSEGVSVKKLRGRPETWGTCPRRSGRSTRGEGSWGSLPGGSGLWQQISLLFYPIQYAPKVFRTSYGRRCHKFPVNIGCFRWLCWPLQSRFFFLQKTVSSWMYIKLCHRESQTVSILASGFLEPLVDQNSWIGFVKHICYSFKKVNELIIVL